MLRPAAVPFRLKPIPVAAPLGLCRITAPSASPAAQMSRTAPNREEQQASGIMGTGAASTPSLPKHYVKLAIDTPKIW